jgi:hypothetical protein
VNPDSDSSIAERPRPFLTRAEAATLLGMTLCVASLFLVWRRDPVDPVMLRSLPAALIVNPPPDFPVRGFDLPLHWPLTVCAVFCGAGLLVQPRPWRRSRWAVSQITAAAICLFLPILRFALQPGILVALLGGGLVVFGALERFGIGQTHSTQADV